MPSIYLQPVDWIEHDKNYRYTIYVFGRTHNGDIARATINGFSPYIYIRAADGETPAIVERALDLRGIKVTSENKLDAMRGFANLQTTKVWKVRFQSLWQFKSAIRKISPHPNEKEYNQYKAFKIGNRILNTDDLYEIDLPPLLRFFHQQNISPASAIHFPEQIHDNDDDCNVDLCYQVNFDQVTPHTSANIPLLVASYDIEVYSDSGQFPVSKNAKDEITQIGISFRWSDKLLESESRYVFVSGKCTPSGTDTQYVSCKNEKDLLLRFAECIRVENPDIMCGYNIYGFDDAYIADRAEYNGVQLNFGRTERESWYRDSVKTERKTFELASGKFAVRYIHMPGRLSVDLYLSIRREQNLDSYKLDNVANIFLRDKVLNIVKIKQQYEIHTKSTRGLFAGNLVRFDIVSNTSNPYKDGQKFYVKEVHPKKFIVETSEDILDDISENDIKKLEWSFAKDDVDTKELFASHHGTPDDRAHVAKYCIQDCDLVLTLIAKLDTLVNARGMADVCYVPIQYIFLRGQGIKIYSAVVYNASKRNQIIMNQESSEEDTSYEGAIVLPPKIGMYLDQPIPVLDFNSLYPSNMIAYNLSPDTLAYVKTYDMNGRLIKFEGIKPEGFKVDEIKYDIKNDKGESIGQTTCGYVQPNEDPNTIGLLPMTLDIILKKRKDTRKLMENTEDDAQKAVLNGLQLAYKVVANSMYGQCGSRTSPIRKLEVAACTTALGRNKIQIAKDIVVGEFGAEVVYGDSVASYTKLDVEINGKQTRIPVEKLGKLGEWKHCTDRDKEYCELNNVYTYTDNGRQKVYRVIRHRLAPSKKMMRVHVISVIKDFDSIKSYIDVTDDHSLLDWNANSIKPNEDIVGTYLLTINNSEPYVVVDKVEEIPYSGYVYDVTTADNHFQAGPFNIVVHNTDSIFVKFPTKDLAESIKLGQQAAEYITNSINRKPYRIEYEKTLYPFILFCRKRYVGMLYEDDPNVKPKRKSMGIALKRRDNAPIVKDIFGGALDILMEERDIRKSQRFVQNMLVDVIQNKISLDKFIITKQLRDDYAAMKEDYKGPATIPAHAVLAKRMTDRDPGNKPQVGDRLAYIYVDERRNEKKQGDKIEHIDYVKAKNLKPDTEFYITNQIQNPVAQMFALAIDQLEGYKGRTNYNAMFNSYLEDGMDEEEATLAVLKKKEKELDDIIFMGADYMLKAMGKPIQTRINSYFVRR